MTERDGPDSPWIQAGRLTFLALYAVTVLAALAWAFSNVRQIDPQYRAVVLHNDINQVEAILNTRHIQHMLPDASLTKEALHQTVCHQFLPD